MNSQQLVRNSIFSLVVLLAILGIPASAQQPSTAAPQALTAREKQAIKTAVARPAAVTFWAVTQEFEGNFDSISAHMAAFEKEARAQNIPNNNSRKALVTINEDPTNKARFRLAVGIVVPKRVEVKAPLKIEQMKFSRAVQFTHVGPYEKLNTIGPNIRSAVKETRPKGTTAAAASTDITFPVAIEGDDPKKVPPAQLRSRLIVPVK